jgi:hypothetical protein
MLAELQITIVSACWPIRCFCVLLARLPVNIIADHAAAHEMSAAHISELRRDLVADHDLALLAALSAAAGASLRCVVPGLLLRLLRLLLQLLLMSAGRWFVVTREAH